jgi:hypothetical protein
MIKTVEAAGSGYRFMPGVSQYSCGIAALGGYTIERARFAEPVPMKVGFERIAKILKAAGRRSPLSAPASCARRRRFPKKVSRHSTRSTSKL